MANYQVPQFIKDQFGKIRLSNLSPVKITSVRKSQGKFRDMLFTTIMFIDRGSKESIEKVVQNLTEQQVEPSRNNRSQATSQNRFMKTGYINLSKDLLQPKSRNEFVLDKLIQSRQQRLGKVQN